MATKAKNFLNTEIKKVTSEEDLGYEQFVIIADIYQERSIVSEREVKVMLDKLIAATRGKDLVLENNAKSLKV